MSVLIHFTETETRMLRRNVHHSLAYYFRNLYYNFFLGYIRSYFVHRLDEQAGDYQIVKFTQVDQ